MLTITPWGPTHHSNYLAEGIIAHSAEGYGGLHLSKERVDQLPPAVAAAVKAKVTAEGDLWLDQEAEWCFAVVAFPDAFKPHQVVEGREVLRLRFPDDYKRICAASLQ